MQNDTLRANLITKHRKIHSETCMHIKGGATTLMANKEMNELQSK
uniref:Uncharacterized protein n=1 Tax=Anguilla anguilla TaxID=7936 RepID=A0A0E9SJ09_ANGAN